MDSQTSDIIFAQFHLASVEPGTYVNPKRLNGIRDCHGALDRPAWSVERRKKAIPQGLDGPALKASDFVSGKLVMFGKNVSPSLVAQPFFTHRLVPGEVLADVLDTPLARIGAKAAGAILLRGPAAAVLMIDENG